MPYNASADAWYQYFSQPGPQWWILVAFYGFRAALATFGFAFNYSMVFVTAKSKSLHGICNILLATESALSAPLDASYYIAFVVFLSGVKFVRYEYCFWALLPWTAMSNMAQATMVIIGLDRLCAVIFPFWYQLRDKKHYLAAAALLLASYGIYFTVLLLIDYQSIKDVMVTCSGEDAAGQGGMGPVMKTSGLTLSGTLLVLYTCTWFFAFMHKSISEKVSEKNRKLIKSILLIICLNLFGVFARVAISLFFLYHPVDGFVTRAFSVAMSCTVIIVYSANAPILYLVSSEYRNKFNKHFNWLPQHQSTADTTTPAPIFQRRMVHPVPVMG